MTRGAGVVAKSNVSNIDVNCQTNSYYVGGAISGAFAGLTLTINDGDALTFTERASTTFKFPKPLLSGEPYQVEVVSEPGHSCRVNAGSGTVGNSDVDTVRVDCEQENRLNVEPRFAAVVARWNGSGASEYTLRLSTAKDCDFDSGTCAGFREIAHATSPLYVGNLINGSVYYFDLEARHAGSEIVLHARSAARPDAPVFDGEVRALAAGTNLTYVAGDFTQLRVQSGAAVPLDWSAGVPSVMPNFPIVEGTVYAVARDSSAGYYVGGSFARIGGVARENIAHVKADGSVDADWNPGANGAVRVLEFADSKLFVGGEFTTIASEARSRLAAFDAAGALSTWAPNPDGRVSAIKVYCVSEPVPPCNVVLGGSFTTISGVPRSNLAMIKTNGQMTPWAPNPDGPVDALGYANSASFHVYVGGRFQTIAGQPRKYLAALRWDGTVEDWAPELNNRVTALEFYANPGPNPPPEVVLYVAGAFTSINGTTRAGLAAFESGSEEPSSWNPQPAPANSVRSIVRSGRSLFLGGTFSSIANQSRHGAALLSVGETAELRAWNPNPDGPVHAIAIAGGAVLIGGEFHGLGGVSRARLAAFEPNGEITSWNPGANGSVHSLLLANDAVYVGGGFTELAGETRHHIGAIEPGGALDGWNPSADGNVYALASRGNDVLAGGAFTEVGGEQRSQLAALNAQAEATAWAPELDGDVRALLVHDDTVYAAGDFENVGAESRRGVVALDASGDPTAWDAGSDGPVHALAMFDGALVVAGNFTDIGDAARARLAALALDTGLATSWAPSPSRAVRALAADATQLYVAGDFLNIDGAGRTRVAAYENSFELVDGYAPAIDGTVNALSIATHVLYLGGEFQHVGSNFASNLGSTSRP